MLLKLISIAALILIMSCIEDEPKLPKKVCKKIPIEGMKFGTEPAYTEKCEYLDR